MAKTSLALVPLPEIHVLLVEDNPSDAFLVSNLLEEVNRAEYVTHEVHSQTEALEYLAKQDYDVCLLDLTLPDASGFSAMIDIQEKKPDLPILILTGINDTVLAKRAVGRGAQDYLMKDELERSTLTRAIDYAMERNRLGKILFQRANFDMLTSLANRDMFVSRLDMALARMDRTNNGIAVLFIDLDRFKPINDGFGHEAGDEILKEVAMRLKNSVRAYDTSARFGGDEFAVLLEGLDEPRDAAAIAQKIIAKLSLPFIYQGRDLELGASIGIAYSHAPESAHTLIQHADIAMYHAKKEGGGMFRFYEEEMQDETNKRIAMERELRLALKEQSLKIFYQPYIAPDNDAIIGAEVLLRWQHRELGLLEAYEFLPDAEHAHLMVDIGMYVLQHLKKDLKLWKNQQLPPLHISLNISLAELDSPEYFAQIYELCDLKLLQPHKLAVEIPENAVNHLSEARFMSIAKLHEMGILLCLDHFGRSSLSLSALRAIPFFMLKLDRTLIQQIGQNVSGDALVQAAILLAHHLGMKTGAVGVETVLQAERLKSHRCDMMQGYLTVKPMTSEELVDWLKKPLK